VAAEVTIQAIDAIERELVRLSAALRLTKELSEAHLKLSS
jgi:hypothetical protein